MVAGDPDDLILDCYRLARWYHQNPDHFIEMGLTRVQQHLFYTLKLWRLQKQASATDDG